VRELVELPRSFPPVSRIRATVLSSSLQAVRERSLQDDYFALLDEEHHDAIHSMIPQSWLPIELAVAHYEAMDQLLSTADAREIGRVVAKRVHHSYLGILVRGIRATGLVSPMRVLVRFDAIVARMIEGGGVRAAEVGSKDALAEIHRIPLAHIPYFRAGIEGICESSLGLIASDATASVKMQGPDILRIRLRWR